MTTRKSTLMKSMTVLGLGSLLFLTGCGASNTPAPSAESATPSANATATESTTPSAAPTVDDSELNPLVTQGMTPEQLENYKKEVARIKAMTPEQREAEYAAQNDPHGERLVAAQEVKAGSTLHVSGGKYAPGATIQVYGAQQMAAPTQDAEGNWVQVGEEVILTEKMTAVATPEGTFDVDLLIPATVAPQMINILGISDDGRSDLIMTTVK